jgi:hypothetical protein
VPFDQASDEIDPRLYEVAHVVDGGETATRRGA